MGRLAVYLRPGDLYRLCRHCFGMVLLGEIDLRQIRANLWSEGGTRNEALGRLSCYLHTPIAPGLVGWAGEEVRANDTATASMITFALLDV